MQGRRGPIFLLSLLVAVILVSGEEEKDALLTFTPELFESIMAKDDMAVIAMVHPECEANKACVGFVDRLREMANMYDGTFKTCLATGDSLIKNLDGDLVPITAFFQAKDLKESPVISFARYGSKAPQSWMGFDKQLLKEAKRWDLMKFDPLKMGHMITKECVPKDGVEKTSVRAFIDESVAGSTRLMFLSRGGNPTMTQRLLALSFNGIARAYYLPLSVMEADPVTFLRGLGISSFGGPSICIVQVPTVNGKDTITSHCLSTSVGDDEEASYDVMKEKSDDFFFNPKLTRLSYPLPKSHLVSELPDDQEQAQLAYESECLSSSVLCVFALLPDRLSESFEDYSDKFFAAANRYYGNLKKLSTRFFIVDANNHKMFLEPLGVGVDALPTSVVINPRKSRFWRMTGTFEVSNLHDFIVSSITSQFSNGAGSEPLTDIPAFEADEEDEDSDKDEL